MQHPLPRVVKKGREDEREQVRVARLTSLAVGILAIFFGIIWKGQNVAYLVALAFAVAASANLPVILDSLYWRRFNTLGAVTGLLSGLAASILLVVIGPSVMGSSALFPLDNPGIVSIPIGFLGAIAGTLLSREPTSEARCAEVLIRAHTGLGAEV